MGEIGRGQILQKAVSLIKDFTFYQKSKEKLLKGCNQRNFPDLY